MPQPRRAAVRSSGLIVALSLLLVEQGPSAAETRWIEPAPLIEAPLDPLSKLSGDLGRRSMAKGSAEQRTVLVRSAHRLDLSAYTNTAHRFRWPAGEEMALIQIRPAALAALAGNPAVVSIAAADPVAAGRRPQAKGMTRDLASLSRFARGAAPWTARGSRADPYVDDAAASRSAANPGGAGARNVQPAGPSGLDGWFDVRDGHRAQEAWDLGFRGEGVRVAVLDEVVDFSHPDLAGTWALLPPGHPYAGWPQVFDPEVGLLQAEDLLQASANDAHVPASRSAEGGMIDLYQQAAVRLESVEGGMRATACFRPLAFVSGDLPRQLGAEACDYLLPTTSRSGRVRMGHHPDSMLMRLGARDDTEGEWAGVIIVDEAVAGTYDTVYVDLDNDRDFSDEKPVGRSSPLSWRDVSAPPDGIQDISGGLLYWISDGRLPFPASWIWGLEGVIPPAGSVIGLHWVQGSHGTLCASNIVSQGRLRAPDDRRLRFRDLPDDGGPPALNLGMAPAAGLVSIGDVYVGGEALFQAGWRYAIFGHSRERDDDDIQVASNSYGWSAVDNDQWDPDSRLIDHYVRRFSPSTVFLSATGNGGPGYGTLSPPSPATGMDIAASTQMGSTGIDSITDTTQIPFGDIIPFSNRGPGARGDAGPDLAANGADAAGAIPINYSSDGAHATVTWGGTSRSTPVAAGAMALAYQAFRQRSGRWPDWEAARAILMGGARFAGYDVFTAGAGVVDAADAVRIAAGLGGIYAMPAAWSAGSYDGRPHAAFANLVRPGMTVRTRLTLRNPSDRPVAVRLSGQWLRRLSTEERLFTADRSTPSGTGGEIPDYLLPIDKASLPSDTDLLVVRGGYPLQTFDPTGKLGEINVWGLRVVQHTDVNRNGRLWSDANGSGTVDSAFLADSSLRLGGDGGDQVVDAVGSGAISTRAVEARLAWFGPSCPDLNDLPAQPVQDPSGAIVLLPDGDCDDLRMIARAQELGAVAAVVFDPETGIRRPIDAGDTPLPIAMIDRVVAEGLRDRLLAGAVVRGAIARRPQTRGIDGLPLVDFSRSEIEPYEFMRMSEEYSPRNSWELSVHHPLQRWADGLYLGLDHTGPSEAVTTTHFKLRLDAYRYQAWPALSLSEDGVTIPSGSEVTVDAALAIAADAAPGLLQGAIFAEYDRREGDVPVAGPGGYELPGRRLVIPVTAVIGADYDWQGLRALGGNAAADPGASYPNDAVRGAMNWNWRPESGDWRFFFVDAPQAPPAGTRLVTRLTWADRGDRRTDIDTRIFGRAPDRFPDDAAAVGSGMTQAAGDPDWFGPYTLQQIAASPYLVNGSIWPFQTSSGIGEDWVAAPSAGGLHLLALHNVLYDGAEVEQRFDLTVSSVRLTPERLDLYGSACGTVHVLPQLDLGPPRSAAFGLAGPPTVAEGLVVRQDDPQSPGSASYTQTLAVTVPTARLDLTLAGRASDDLDLYLRFDANGDGVFDEAETLASSTSSGAAESVSLRRPIVAGRYLILVHGYRVTGGSAGFRLTTDLLGGNGLTVTGDGAAMSAGGLAAFRVCPAAPGVDSDGPLRGLVTLGPAGAPDLLELPVTWRRRPPSLLLPLQVQGETWGQR
jgi:subtilisin family serine protease